jgi:hypothetical protein
MLRYHSSLRIRMKLYLPFCTDKNTSSTVTVELNWDAESLYMRVAWSLLVHRLCCLQSVTHDGISDLSSSTCGKFKNHQKDWAHNNTQVIFQQLYFEFNSSVNGLPSTMLLKIKEFQSHCSSSLRSKIRCDLRGGSMSKRVLMFSLICI